MPRRGGGDLQRFNASDGPDNASPRERENLTQPFHFFHFTNKTFAFFFFPYSTWPHSALALRDQQDQSGRIGSAACSCVQGHLSNPARR